nr:MAG TPA: hypothetical protein [Caudoviricetes sp.]
MKNFDPCKKLQMYRRKQAIKDYLKNIIRRQK